jgi:hypothetical protein
LHSTKALVRLTGVNLLSVGYEKIDAKDGSSKLLTLWNSSKIRWNRRRIPRAKISTAYRDSWRFATYFLRSGASYSGYCWNAYQKRFMNLIASLICIFISNFAISYLLLFLWIWQISKNFFRNILLTKLKSTKGLIH